MNLLYRIIGAAVLFCAATVYSMAADGRVQKTYNISETEKPFMQSCNKAMSKHNLSFAAGANRSKGCACLTKTLMSSAEPNEVLVIQDYIAFTMQTRALAEGSDIDFIALQENIETINEKHKLNDIKAFEYINLVGEAILTCGDKKNHTPQKVAEYAAMSPKVTNVKTASNQRELHKTTSVPKSSPNRLPTLRGLSNG